MPRAPKKLSILSLQYYSFPDEVGGAWKVTHEVNKRLVAMGHQVSLITCKPSHSLPDSETIDGVRFERVGFRASKNSIRLWRGVRKLAHSICDRSPVNLIHIHNPLVGFLALTVPRLWRIPKVYHFHSSWYDEERINRRQENGFWLEFHLNVIRLMEWFCYLSAKSVLFLSEYSRRRFLEYYPWTGPRPGGMRLNLVSRFIALVRFLCVGPSSTGRVGGIRLEVIPGGVDVEEFRPLDPRESLEGLREALELPTDKPVLLTVRRLEARMGLENLIEAVEVLKHRCPELDFLLVIGGKGSLAQPRDSLVKEKGLDDRVKLRGKIPNEKLPLYYRASDVFILPTTSIEGFGLVTVEALASGLPVLGTPVGGTVEILGAIDEKLLFNGTGPDSLADGIEAFLKNSQPRDLLKKNCRDTALLRYSWDRVMGRIEDILIQSVKV
ncbi:MAG: glycosyltransferase family 4 protein [Nitrospinaceae bacterium]